MTTAIYNPSIRTSIFALSDTAEGVVDLRVLRVIDQTEEALMGVRKICGGVEQLARGVEVTLKACPVIAGELIDPDFSMQERLDEVIAQVVNILSVLAEKRAAVHQDSGLQDHHRALLYGTYDTVVDAVALLVDALKDLAAALIAHDLEADTRDVKSYPEIHELHSDILKS
jgi:hypothetical protein